MRRVSLALAVTAMCALLVACGSGNAVSGAPSAQTTEAGSPNGPTGTPWRPEFCAPAAPGASGGSNQLSFSGTCAFVPDPPLECHVAADDFYVLMRQKLSSGWPILMYVTVEHYHGPGTYENQVEIYVVVQDGPALYRWANLQGAMTVGPGETSASFSRPVDLGAQPGTPATGVLRLGGSIACTHA